MLAPAMYSLMLILVMYSALVLSSASPLAKCYGGGFFFMVAVAFMYVT